MQEFLQAYPGWYGIAYIAWVGIATLAAGLIYFKVENWLQGRKGKR